jgi:hypothetical protein
LRFSCSVSSVLIGGVHLSESLCLFLPATHLSLSLSRARPPTSLPPFPFLHLWRPLLSKVEDRRRPSNPRAPPLSTPSPTCPSSTLSLAPIEGRSCAHKRQEPCRSRSAGKAATQSRAPRVLLLASKWRHTEPNLPFCLSTQPSPPPSFPCLRIGAASRRVSSHLATGAS